MRGRRWRAGRESISSNDANRRLVHGELAELAGAREADLMMELFSNQDVDAQLSSLRAELHIEMAGVRTDMIDRLARVRTDMATGFAGIEADLADVKAEMRELAADTHAIIAEGQARSERAMRFQIIWIIATMISITGIAIAVLS